MKTSGNGGGGGGSGNGGKKSAEQKLKRILKKQFSNVIDPCPLINSTYWLPLLRHHPIGTVTSSLPSAAAAATAIAGPIMSPVVSATTTTIGSPAPTQHHKKQSPSLLSPSHQQQSICDAFETGTENDNHVMRGRMCLEVISKETRGERDRDSQDVVVDDDLGNRKPCFANDWRPESCSVCFLLLGWQPWFLDLV